MNENLNLVEILKNCPKGTKLYSPLFGEVEFQGVTGGATFPVTFPITVSMKDGNTYNFTLEGRVYTIYEGECLLFPSKDQRDWSKFNDGIKAADAEPNLESLWHDASEEPLLEGKEIIFLNEQGIPYISERFGGTFSYMLDDFYWEKYVNLLKISKWAYISDLLPKGGEK